jgi:hypothetical protein
VTDIEAEIDAALEPRYSCGDLQIALLLHIFLELQRRVSEPWSWNIHEPDAKNLDYAGASFKLFNENDLDAPNFCWGGTKIWWYKYFDRDVECNREWSDEDWIVWHQQCLNAIRREHGNGGK